VSDLTFTSDGLHLAGTLALGAEPRRSACVLMVPGSGQVDRDENHKRLRINVFGELAGHLAERGFDSLRYDKRGVGQSEGDFWTAGLYDNAADVEAALSAIRANAAVAHDKVFVLGHSEGAYLATIVSGRIPDLAGVVLLAGGARPGEEELRWQAGRVVQSLTGFSAFLIKLLRIDPLKAQAKQLERIKQSREDVLRVQLLTKINAKWMREMLVYDPAADLSKIASPVLALTGTKDLQVDPGNLELMARLVNAPFQAHAVPDVTHILRADPGNPSLSNYREQAKRPVDPRVVELILEWLERQVAS